MKNVLMIAYYFPPSGVSGIYRTMRFIKFLPACGWRPMVLTLRDDGYEAGEPRDDSLHAMVPDDLVVIRTTELRILEGLQRLRQLRWRAASRADRRGANLPPLARAARGRQLVVATL